jgi:flavin-dependent dehydrogenase
MSAVDRIPGDRFGSSETVWDVAVVGAGPAGAMTAYELSRTGCSVVLMDREAFPRWKVCGACISPGAQEVLREAGLGGLFAGLGGSPLEHLEVRGWNQRARIALKGSVALSRAALDSALAEAAAEQGATFVQGVRVRWGPPHPDYALLKAQRADGPVDIRARVVVAADGVRSGLLAQAGLQGPNEGLTGKTRVGLGAVFNSSESEYSSGTIHMAVGDAGYVGLVRTEDGSLDVAAAVDPEFLRTSSSPGEAVNNLLCKASFSPLFGNPSDGWKGTRLLCHRPRHLGAVRLFAVGDAAGYVEPFTGEGICWALAGARALAPIVARAVQKWHAGFLGEWSDTYGLTVAPSQRLCSATAWTLRRPALSRVAVGVLGRFPWMAAPLVGRAATAPQPIRRRGS